jgi:hypothetical protein
MKCPFSKGALAGGAPFVAPQPISPITGEELQVKFLASSEENSLKY